MRLGVGVGGGDEVEIREGIGGNGIMGKGV